MSGPDQLRGNVSSSAQEILKVLVVEDEFLIAEEMAAVLEDAGHVVLGPAASVRAAEAMLADDQPDVAVIDANLRGETSAPLAASLRDRGIPFCVCTGYRINDLKALFGDIVTIQKPSRPGAAARNRGDAGRGATMLDQRPRRVRSAPPTPRSSASRRGSFSSICRLLNRDQPAAREAVEDPVGVNQRQAEGIGDQRL